MLLADQVVIDSIPQGVELAGVEGLVNVAPIDLAASGGLINDIAVFR